NLKELDVSGGLALDSYEAILKGTKERVVQPGKSADSLLIQRVTSTDEEKRMPLAAPPLPAEIVALLRRWIDSGAKEGPKPAGTDTAVASRAPARNRKLDVTLGTSAVPPKG